MNKIKFYFLIILRLLMGVLVNGCSDDQQNTEAAPVAVRVITPEKRNIAERLSYLGTVTAQSEVKVIAQVQGTVQALPLEEGAKMKKGDILVKLFAPELEATVLRLQADRDYWNRRNASDKRLLEQRAIPPDQEEASKRASIYSEAAFKEAAFRLQKTIEKSAFDGIVLKWFAEPGQHVMPGQPILLIGTNKSEISVEVVEEDVRRGIHLGTPATIKSDKGNFITGSVAEVAPLANAGTRTMTVKIQWADNDKIRIPIGASAAVDFILHLQKQTLSVPESAITDADINPYLYLIKKDRAFKQFITLGIEEDGWISTEFDWNGIDPVAVTNLNSLSDSCKVFAVPLTEVAQ